MKPVVNYGTPFWVVGQPIEHTLSPEIHNAAFEQAGLEHRYFAQEVGKQELGDFFEFLEGMNLPGANMTLPLKEKATRLISENRQDKAVRKIGAANTVYRTAGGLKLANTDVYGFKKLLVPWEDVVREEPVLLLGAGGAARACLAALEEMECRQVFIWNRTEKKARRLAEEFGVLQPEVISREELENSLPPVKMVINATSLGLKRGDTSPFPVEQINEKMIGVDLIYNRRTKFVKDFLDKGRDATGGLKMLVHQAARAWHLWLDRQPDTEVMLARARQFLS
ncbi:MAG: shikimate dehydrogenase family protein [bacterium]